MTDDARARFLAMRYKADMKAREKEKRQNFEEHVRKAKEEKRWERLDRARSGAIVQHIADSLDKRAPLIEIINSHNRPGVKLVERRLRGMKPKPKAVFGRSI